LQLPSCFALWFSVDSLMFTVANHYILSATRILYVDNDFYCLVQTTELPIDPILITADQLIRR